MEEKSSRSSSRLKERLAKIFQPKSLLHSSSATAAAVAMRSTPNTSSRTLLADVALAPRRRRVHADTTLVGLSQSKSFSTVDTHRRHFSVDCGGCRPNRDSLPPPLLVKTSKAKDLKSLKKKKERRVRENGGFYVNGEGEGRTCPPSSPSMNSSYYEKKTKKKTKKKQSKKLLTNGYGFSSSSSIESDDGFGFFSSEEEAVKGEKETFFSSRSFSSDSSEFYQRPHSSKRKQSKTKKKTKKGSPSRRLPPRRRAASCDGCKVREGCRPLVSAPAKETKKGFAVVKRSSDPYNDFRNSMVEMIVERQIFGAKDLERLLHSYLALNSTHHHPVILQAFSDIWVVLFAN